jgi:oxaloacetate decarboxylase alpha subunit
VAQVPGGMLTNMESQLREQGAAERLDEVLIEIPRVRQDLGYLPLVTPTSQIVGTQAVLNVLSGERYQNISRETAGVLKGEYGATPAPVDAGLQARVLEGAAQVQCRPADLLPPEVETQSAQLHRLAREQGLSLASDAIDDVLTYALFPRVGLNFIKNRNNPAAFEPAPNADAATEVVSAGSAAVDSAAVDSAAVDSAVDAAGPMVYSVTVNGQQYQVEVAEGGAINGIQAAAVEAPQPVVAGDAVTAPLAGTIFKVNVREGDHVQEGEIIVVLEAMKMETEVRAPRSASVSSVRIREGDNVAVGDELVILA